MYTKNWRQDTSQSAEIRITQNSSLLYHHPHVTKDDGDDSNFLITQLRLVGTHRGTGRLYLFVQASMFLRSASMMDLWVG